MTLVVMGWKDAMPQDQYAIDSTKIAYHVDKLHQWLTAKATLTPIYIEVSPVGYCNHRCTFCALDFMGYKPIKMETDKLIKLMYELGSSGVKSVMFGGEGEPLLHPDLPEVLEHGKRAGLSLAITTNGIGLTKRYLPYLQYLDWIKISVNGGNQEVYTTIHQCADKDWHTLWANVIEATYYIQEAKLDTVIGTQAVVLPDNIDSLENLAYLSMFYGCKYLVLKPYSQHSASKHKIDLDYSKHEFKTIGTILQAYEKDETFKIIYREEATQAVGKEIAYPTCLAVPYFWAYITTVGNVYGCSAFLQDERFNYGNLYEQAWADIWLGDRRKVAMVLMDKFSTEECRKGCRMNEVNKYLHTLKRGCLHKEFI